MVKLRAVRYLRIKGKLVAEEHYDNGETRRVFLRKGVLNYIWSLEETPEIEE